MLVEALPTLVSNFTIMMINMLNTSAMAGAVGAGGLGAVAWPMAIKDLIIWLCTLL